MDLLTYAANAKSLKKNILKFNMIFDYKLGQKVEIRSIGLLYLCTRSSISPAFAGAFIICVAGSVSSSSRITLTRIIAEPAKT